MLRQVEISVNMYLLVDSRFLWWTMGPLEITIENLSHFEIFINPRMVNIFFSSLMVNFAFEATNIKKKFNKKKSVWDENTPALDVISI